MNRAIASASASASADDAAMIRMCDTVTLGMPALCRTGLSENWLFRQAGHRHWLALAAAYGLDTPDFHDDQGRRLYPAFTRVQVEDARLDLVDVRDLLAFTTILERTGRSRFSSRIYVTTPNLLVVTLEMETVFVRRMEKGANHSAGRAQVARPCRLLPPARPAVFFKPAQWTHHDIFARDQPATGPQVWLDPVPQEDFNGADFLYFASFQALLDRAEWSCFRRLDPLLTSDSRLIHYIGNIDPGDRISCRFGQIIEDEGRLSHWTELHRESDGALIAIAFTKRRNSLRASQDVMC